LEQDTSIEHRAKDLPLFSKTGKVPWTARTAAPGFEPRSCRNKTTTLRQLHRDLGSLKEKQLKGWKRTTIIYFGRG
jgi:hypothetical protein